MKETVSLHQAAKDLIAEAYAFAESLRVRELRRLNILDTPSDHVYDDVVSVAAHICNVPTAMIILIDESRAYIKASENGFPQGDFPREETFCATAIADPKKMLIVPDARLDSRFNRNPLVTSKKVLFYAGMPMVSNGYALGALCLTDDEPHENFSAQQISALESVARITERLLITTPALQLPEDGIIAKI